MNTTSKLFAWACLVLVPCCTGCGTSEFERRLEGAVSKSRQAETIRLDAVRKAQEEQKKKLDAKKPKKNETKITQEDLEKALQEMNQDAPQESKQNGSGTPADPAADAPPADPAPQ
jgi:predicted  nucleic acid-binding Zn-ribbon protein